MTTQRIYDVNEMADDLKMTPSGVTKAYRSGHFGDAVYKTTKNKLQFVMPKAAENYRARVDGSRSVARRATISESKTPAPKASVGSPRRVLEHDDFQILPKAEQEEYRRDWLSFMAKLARGEPLSSYEASEVEIWFDLARHVWLGDSWVTFTEKASIVPTIAPQVDAPTPPTEG